MHACEPSCLPLDGVPRKGPVPATSAPWFAASHGADLLWWAKNSAVLLVAEQLADGSYLSQIYAARDKRRHAGPATVRVVECTLAGARPRCTG